MILEYFNIAVKNLRKRKLRLLLTLIGVIISVAAIFILISVSLGLQAAVTEQFRLLGADKFFVQPRGQFSGPGAEGAVELTEDDAEIIRNVPGVKDLAPWTLAPANLSFQGRIRYTLVMGIDLETSPLFIESGAYQAEEGRLLLEGDQGKVMIGSQYKHNLYLGQEVKVGNRLSINGREFPVTGILKPLGNPSDDRMIHMSFEDFRPLFKVPSRIDSIVVQIKSGEDLQEVAKKVEKKLMKFRHVDEQTIDFTVLTPEELLGSFAAILKVITSFLLAVAGISLIIGGLGIANTMYTSVLERAKEIGLMKAVGAQRNDVLLIFVIESGLLGLLGGVIGVIVGILASKLIEYIAVKQLGTTLLQTAIPAWLIISCGLFSFLIGAISGFWPAYRALKVKPVEALRQE